MAYSGYPTPDEILPQTFRCIQVYVPDCVNDEFVSVLIGQIGELTKEYYWKPEGDLTPEQCAFLWSQTLALTNADGEDCTLTCEQIIYCIENDSDTRGSLLQYLSDVGIQPNSGDNPPVPISATQTDEQLLPVGYTCDNDHLFGMSRWIVQQLDKSVRQFLLQIELLTDPVELAAVFADNVEGVSWFGGGLEMAAWLQDQLITWYDAAYTPAHEDELACEIFCIIKDDCTLTMDRILEAYSENTFGLPPDTDDWLVIMQWLINTTFNADIQTVATYHYFLAQALRFGGSVLLFDGFRGLKQIIGMGASETDDDWNILCNCVTTWCNLFDFTTGQQGFIPNPAAPFGQRNANGYEMTYGSAGGIFDNRNTADREFGVDFTANSYTVKYIGTAGGSQRTLQLVGDNDNNLVFLHNFGAYDISGVEQTVIYGGTHTVDELRFSCSAQLPSASDPDALAIKSLKIEGSTGNPPVAENC